jgi:hypothetical protein
VAAASLNLATHYLTVPTPQAAGDLIIISTTIPLCYEIILFFNSFTKIIEMSSTNFSNGKI